MRKLIVSMAALTITAMAAQAQEYTVKPEIRPLMGVYVPTGEQRDLFDNAPMFGVQAALEFRPTFHLLGTFGWVPGQTKYPGDNDVQILQYDAGFELDMIRELDNSWTFKPFFGLGAGAHLSLRERQHAGPHLRGRIRCARRGAGSGAHRVTAGRTR